MSEPEQRNRDTCATCRFWQPAKHGKLGQCRTRSPVVVVAGEIAGTRWPMTAADDWCGEHDLRDPPQGDY